VTREINVRSRFVSSLSPAREVYFVCSRGELPSCFIASRICDIPPSDTLNRGCRKKERNTDWKREEEEKKRERERERQEAHWNLLRRDVGEVQSTKFDYADPAGVSAHVFSRFLDPDSARGCISRDRRSNGSRCDLCVDSRSHRARSRSSLGGEGKGKRNGTRGENATTRVKSRVYEIVFLVLFSFSH
jgi:hypothetical protein